MAMRQQACLTCVFAMETIRKENSWARPDSTVLKQGQKDPFPRIQNHLLLSTTGIRHWEFFRHSVLISERDQTHRFIRISISKPVSRQGTTENFQYSALAG